MNLQLNTVAAATVCGNPPISPFAKGDIGGFGTHKFNNFVEGLRGWGGGAGQGDDWEISLPVFPKPVHWLIRPLLSGAGRTRTPSAPPTAGVSAWPVRGTPATPLLPDGSPGNPRCSAAGRHWYRPIPQRWSRLKKRCTPGLRRRGHPFLECVGSPFGLNLRAQDYLYE